MNEHSKVSEAPLASPAVRTPAIRTPAIRTPAIRTIAMPADTNSNGDIFGGWVMSQMDIAGSIPASVVGKGRIATVAVTSMRFIKPVGVGDLVSCYARVTKTGRTSITVDVDTWAKRHLSDTEEKVAESIIVYVAIDDQGRPRPL